MKMPRAFLVLNKKSKSKYKKNTAGEEQDVVTDENQNVQGDADQQKENLTGEVDDNDSEEDIEVDVDGPCSAHDELILPHSGERDSVTSVSPGSSTSTSQQPQPQRNCSPSPVSFRSLVSHQRPEECVYQSQGQFYQVCFNSVWRIPSIPSRVIYHVVFRIYTSMRFC